MDESALHYSSMQDKTLTAARLSPADCDLARRVLAFYKGRLQSEDGRQQASTRLKA